MLFHFIPFVQVLLVAPLALDALGGPKVGDLFSHYAFSNVPTSCVVGR